MTDLCHPVPDSRARGAGSRAVAAARRLLRSRAIMLVVTMLSRALRGAALIALVSLIGAGGCNQEMEHGHITDAAPGSQDGGAGASDAGIPCPDAGPPPDAGTPPDGGILPDAGVPPDAGLPPDGGLLDAGPVDPCADRPDGGLPDAGA